MNKQITEYLLPKRIADVSQNVLNSATLLYEKSAQIALDETDVCIATGGFVLLDFGREISGGVRILCHKAGSGSTVVRIRFGESYGEANAELGYMGACNDHSPRDFSATLVNYSDLTFGQTGFRFVRIDFPEGEAVKIKSVYAAFTHYGGEPIGDFACNDELINKIYDTARYTVMLNMQNGVIWDGIKRDRLVWVGDMYPEVKAILYTYGGEDCIKNSLRFAMQTNPQPGWISRMPSYTIWFVAILHEYFYYTGDDAFLRECAEYLYALGELFDDRVDERGRLLFNDERQTGKPVFLDWQTVDLPETEQGVSALLRIAVHSGITLCERLGISAKAYKSVLEKLNRRVAADTEYKQITALQILSGERDAESGAEKLVLGGANGMSTFMSGLILSAVAKGRKMRAAQEILRRYYGGMLSRGATSFWEDFDIDWLNGSGRIDEPTPQGLKDLHGDFGAYCYTGFRHSLCHGWACGPVNFLTECVLGICVEEASCRKISVRPDLGDLTFARGSIATPYGKVTVMAQKDENGKVNVHVDAPKDVEILYGDIYG